MPRVGGKITGKAPVHEKGFIVDDISRLILEAWDKLGPKIKADPDELAKRVARRRSALLTRPPRAWCIAVRASDRRITPAHWIIYPEHAMDLNHEDHPYHPIEHEVTIDARALRKFCRPVKTDSWGEEVADVANWLGVTKQTLDHARHAGIFTERSIKGLGGKRGKPVPLIHSWKRLDPSGTGFFAPPDTLWGSLWEFLPDMIPDDFQQTLIRRPRFSTWAIAQNRPPAPPDHQYNEDARFEAWRWVCPGCKRPVRKVHYPLAPQTLFDFFRSDPAPGELNEVPKPPGAFACYRCHGLGYFGRTTASGWNEVVSWLTRGMLYGREVQKPQWYRIGRKNRRHRQLNRRAIKREAILRRLSNGWTIADIARDMLIRPAVVRGHVRIIFKHERVTNRQELAAKLGWKHDQPLSTWEKRRALARQRDELVEPLLREGLKLRQISQRLAFSRSIVDSAVERIFRKHGILRKAGRAALLTKLTAAAPPQIASPHL